MKLWLDDVRPAPEGWEWAKTAKQAISFLNTHSEQIEAVSLDHDLGKNAGSGEHVARHLSGYKQLNPETPIRIHSWNPGGARLMAHWLKEAGYPVEVRPFSFGEN